MIASYLWEAARRWPEKTALQFGDQKWTYAHFVEAVIVRAMDLQRRGIEPEDRIAIIAANSPDWLFWYAAINAIGSTAVPINPAYTAHEITAILETADLKLIIIDSENQAARKLRLPADLEDCCINIVSDRFDAVNPSWRPTSIEKEAPAVIYFSSGSTGKPKGIVHSGRSLGLIADCVRDVWRFEEKDCTLVAMPLAFIYASTVGWLSSVRAGGSIVLQSRFDSGATLKQIAAGTLTTIIGVPIMYHQLLELQKTKLPHNRLRVCLSSGNGLSRQLDEEYYEIFDCPIFEFFGLSEMPHVISHSLSRDNRSRPFSCGRAVEGVEVQVRDDNSKPVATGQVGELVCRAPFGFQEYFRDPEMTQSAVVGGWFHTGDLVRQDDDGYIFFVERKKELIKSSGFNIMPGELEQVIASIPGVREVAVVGAPDALKGEHVAAFIVRENEITPSSEEIIAVCRGLLAKYKIPEEIRFVSELPRGPTGKLQKKKLRELAGASGNVATSHAADRMGAGPVEA